MMVVNINDAQRMAVQEMEVIVATEVISDGVKGVHIMFRNGNSVMIKDLDRTFLDELLNCVKFGESPKQGDY